MQPSATSACFGKYSVIQDKSPEISNQGLPVAAAAAPLPLETADFTNQRAHGVPWPAHGLGVGPELGLTYVHLMHFSLV